MKVYIETYALLTQSLFPPAQKISSLEIVNS